MGEYIAIGAEREWKPIEGRSAAEIRAQHADPLGALQRGEVPAIILRGAVPRDEMSALAVRMARAAAMPMPNLSLRKNVSNGFSTSSHYRERSECAAFAPGLCACRGEVGVSGCNESEPCCAGSRELGPPLRKAGCLKRSAICSKHMEFYGHKYIEYGFKLQSVVSQQPAGQQPIGRLGAKNRFHYSAWRHARARELLEEGCDAGPPGHPGAWCSPAAALLHGLQQIGGPARQIRVARDMEPVEAVEAGAAGLGADDEACSAWPRHVERTIFKHGSYAPGILRVMGESFSYGTHYDSNHAEAWDDLRRESCTDGEALYPPRIEESRCFSTADICRPLRQHPFSAAAILTVQEPDRRLAAADINVWRVRWPALVFLSRNCTSRSIEHAGRAMRNHGVGTWLPPGDTPAELLGEPAAIRGDAGDLYLFNSEFIHSSPSRGPPSGSKQDRIVLGAIAGYSASSRLVEVWS